MIDKKRERRLALESFRLYERLNDANSPTGKYHYNRLGKNKRAQYFDCLNAALHRHERRLATLYKGGLT